VGHQGPQRGRRVDLTGVASYPISQRNYSTRKKNRSPAHAIELWRPIVQSCLPFNDQLSGATNLGLKSTERVDEALRRFESMIEATRDSKQETFDSFAAKVEQAT
jgi:hypothetical protein